MNYFKELLSSFKCLIYILIEMTLLFFATFLFACHNPTKIEYYITHYVSIISIIININLIIIIIRKNHIRMKKPNLKKMYPYVCFSLSFTVFINMLTILNGKTISNNYNIYILIISTCFIGPIFEELIFRKLLCDKLIKFNSKKKTIVISSLIFSVMHLDFLKSFYAFVVGLVYGALYQKNKNIKEPIIAHIISNLIVLIIHTFDKITFIISIFSMLLSLITLVSPYIKLRKTCKITNS